MKYGDSSQKMLIKGVIGEVDGCKIVKVPANRLPAGCAFLIAHPNAATAPKQLNDYKIHENPPGISGWLVEGRLIFDCFVLNEKADAIYYHGAQAMLKDLIVGTAATGMDESTVTVHSEMEGSARWYVTADSVGELPAVTYGTAVSTSGWTKLEGASAVVNYQNGDKFIRVVELDSTGKPVAVGTNVLNIG